MYMQFFLPMQPPTTTHNAKQLHAYMKGGQPHAVLHDSPELKQTRAKLHAHLAPTRRKSPSPQAVRCGCWSSGASCRGPQNGSWRTAKPDTDNLKRPSRTKCPACTSGPMTRRCAARSWRNSGRTPAACSSGWRNCK